MPGITKLTTSIVCPKPLFTPLDIRQIRRCLSDDAPYSCISDVTNISIFLSSYILTIDVIDLQVRID